MFHFSVRDHLLLRSTQGPLDLFCGVFFFFFSLAMNDPLAICLLKRCLSDVYTRFRGVVFCQLEMNSNPPFLPMETGS